LGRSAALWSLFWVKLTAHSVYIEILRGVESRLGHEVSPSSVKHLLHLESRRKRQRIERLSRGVYRAFQIDAEPAGGL
jgi:predicted transcriptional regulator of viral defense system